MNNHVYLISQFYYANILVSNILSIIHVIMITIFKMLICFSDKKLYLASSVSLVNVARIKMASRSARAINKNSLVVADPSKAVQAFCTKYHYIDLECLTTGESLVNILSSEDSYAPKSTFSF